MIEKTIITVIVIKNIIVNIIIILSANPVGIAIGSILSTMIVWQSGNADTDRFNIRILVTCS